MIVRLTPGDTRPIYLQIMDEVRRAVVLGTLGADDPLPSTRELARDLRVNPNTVQLAYRELERLGVVYVKRGQGTYVANSGTPEKERQRLVRDVSARALRDAFRHGITVEQLISALEVESKRDAHLKEKQSDEHRGNSR
jgi:GntR family transcriptional regulator